MQYNRLFHLRFQIPRNDHVPNLTLNHLLLWDYVEVKAYANRTQALVDLQAAVHEEVATISQYG